MVKIKIWHSELILKNILELKNNLQKAWVNFRSQISTRFSPFSSSFFHQLWIANDRPVAFATSKTTWIPSLRLPFFSNESRFYFFLPSKKSFEDSCRRTAVTAQIQSCILLSLQIDRSFIEISLSPFELVHLLIYTCACEFALPSKSIGRPIISSLLTFSDLEENWQIRSKIINLC